MTVQFSRKRALPIEECLREAEKKIRREYRRVAAALRRVAVGRDVWAMEVAVTQPLE